MDASDAVDLVRVATCSRVLHDLFSDAAVKALHQVAAQRDAALQERDDARMERDAAVAFTDESHRDFNRLLDLGLRAARQRTEARQQRDEARRERDTALEELAEAKRARTG